MNSDVLSWASLANSSQTDLGPNTCLYDLMPKEQAGRIHPRAEVDQVFLDRLFTVLSQSTEVLDDHVFIDWRGYSEHNQDSGGAEIMVPRVGPWEAYELLAQVQPFSMLYERGARGRRLPLYVWSLDHQIVLSCPIYSDSLYLASSNVTSDLLISHNIEASAISSNDFLAITGD